MSLALNRDDDDLLLHANEILYAWEITNRRLRRLVLSGALRRVRRPGYQPYYAFSAVVAILGQPKRDPMPPYRSGYDDGANYEGIAA